MAIKTYGLMAVDWEERVNYDRLRTERLARIKKLLKESEMGALLCFDMTNVRYITATHIGTWAMDKLARFTLLPQDDEPILWDFGSAARHHQQPRRRRAGHIFNARRRPRAGVDVRRHCARLGQQQQRATRHRPRPAVRQQ